MNFSWMSFAYLPHSLDIISLNINILHTTFYLSYEVFSFYKMENQKKDFTYNNEIKIHFSNLFNLILLYNLFQKYFFYKAEEFIEKQITHVNKNY